MSDPGAAIHRKPIVQMLGVVLTLPILYALSSGPILRYSAQPLPSMAVVRYAGSTLTVKSPPDHMRSLYAPLFRAAAITHLEGPLFAYLEMWHIFAAHSGQNHVTPVLLEKP